MLKKLNNKSKLQKGFTIIEVMIVLAIAGLILVVVLIAIPQLQRNQRNEARRSAAGRIVTEINNFAGNNNGTLPTAAIASGQQNLGSPRAALGFFNRYIGCSITAPATTPVCTANINDPQTGFPMGTQTNGTADYIAAGVGVNNAVPPVNAANSAGSIYYGTGVICGTEATTTTGASARNFAFLVRLEGGAIYCLDNR